MRDRDRGGGAIGGLDDILCKLCDVKVMDNRRAGCACEQNIDGLLAIEDAAGRAELSVFVGEERNKGLAVGLSVGMEKTLFE